MFVGLTELALIRLHFPRVPLMPVPLTLQSYLIDVQIGSKPAGSNWDSCVMPEMVTVINR